MGRGNLFLRKRKVFACLLAAAFLLGEILPPVSFKKAAAAGTITISVVTTEEGVQKTVSGGNLETALDNLKKASGIQISQIKELVITGGQIQEDDWTYIYEHSGNDGSEDPGQFSSLTDFRAQGAGRGTGAIPDGDVMYKNFPNSIERMEIPNGIISIGEYAFERCKMQELTIPGSVKTIGSSAFGGCYYLVTVNLSEGLETIGSSAFSSCSRLERIEIPDSVTEIGQYAFRECGSLKEAILPQNLTTIDFDTFSDSGLQSITIPDSVTTIRSYAFKNCPKLKEIIFPESVTTIGGEVFMGCSGLKEVTFSKSLQYIGNASFADCTGLTKVVIPGNVKTIGGRTFFGCSNLEQVVIEEGVETIGQAAFEETAIKSIKIPNSINTISAYLFSKCSKLTKVDIPVSVENIGIYAFADCDNLTEVTIPVSVRLLSPCAFENCSKLSKLRLLVKSKKEVAAINTQITTEELPYGPFENCPTPRRMYFYTERGLPLSESTVPTYSDAVAAYRVARDGDTSDNLWWGWQMEEAYSVVSHLTNLTGSNEAVVWRETDKDYTTTLTPAASAGDMIYTLPAEVMVKIGEHTASPEEDYTYDPVTGTLLIKASSINGNIEIEAVAGMEPKPAPTASPTPSPTPTASPTPEPTGSPTPDPIPTISPTSQPMGSPTPNPTPTASPTPEPAGSPTPDPVPTVGPTLDPTPEPTPVPTQTPVPNKDVSDIADGLGVSGETAQKIQEVSKELDVSKDTILVTDNTIKSQKTDNDVKGAYFARIQARASQITQNNIKLVWNKVKGADGYLVYGNRCNSKKWIYEYKLLKTVTNSNKCSYIERKCKKGKYYKFIVRAYKNIDGKKVTIAVSKTIHVVTNGGKNGNAGSVKVNKGSVSLKKGKTFRIKAKEIKQKKKLRYHRKLCYESSDPKVASVSKQGAIKAKKKGKCNVYVYAQNGIYRKVKVTVT